MTRFIGAVFLLNAIFSCACVLLSGFKVTSTMFSSVSEIVFAISVVVLLINNKNKIIRSIGYIVLCVYFFIYTMSCYYFYISTGEFISSLAISNFNYAYIFLSPESIVAIILVTISMVGFCLLLRSINISTCRNKIIFLVVISFIMCLLQNGGLKCVLNKNFRDTPVVSFVKNTYKAFFINEINVEGYPFEKNETYAYNDRITNTSNNNINVILIFTEGTSARLLGCYNEKFNDLTPNIDDFSDNSMVVKNYFNHTAATFRGTLGQLESGYTVYAGSGTGGSWSKNSNKLKSMTYSTIPSILNDKYNTMFISPHVSSDPYTDLLKMAGFNKVYTFDTMEELLNEKQDGTRNSIKDADMYKALKSAVLNSDDKKPFFIAMYTLDTHLGIGLPDDGIAYESSYGNVESLNSLHNLDAAFGDFWSWFKTSKYATNTIIVFTSDHAHYNEKSYVDVVKNDEDYTACFIDKVPLIIYDPIHKLSGVYDANGKNSLSLAPTMFNLLSIHEGTNAFLGKSIFDDSDDYIRTCALGHDYYYVYNNKVLYEKDIPSSEYDRFVREKNLIELYYGAEVTNKLIDR